MGASCRGAIKCRPIQRTSLSLSCPGCPCNPPAIPLHPRALLMIVLHIRQAPPPARCLPSSPLLPSTNARMDLGCTSAQPTCAQAAHPPVSLPAPCLPSTPPASQHIHVLPPPPPSPPVLVQHIHQRHKAVRRLPVGCREHRHAAKRQRVLGVGKGNVVSWGEWRVGWGMCQG